MTPEILPYALAQASLGQLEEHLRACDSHFVPPLSTRVDIGVYASKLHSHSVRFEAWSGATLVGLVACYANDPAGFKAHVSSVTVLPAWNRKGIARTLMASCIELVKDRGFIYLTLHVDPTNTPALNLYLSLDFQIQEATPSNLLLCLAFSR